MTFLQWIRSVNNKEPVAVFKKYREAPMSQRLIWVLSIAERMGENPDYKKEVRFLIEELYKIKD